jgi:hypothetical protein
MAQKRYDEAETTLLTGMEALLTHHQTVPASELGQQLIKLYVDTHKTPTDAAIGSFTHAKDRRLFGAHVCAHATVRLLGVCLLVSGRVQRRSFDTSKATAPTWMTAV